MLVRIVNQETSAKDIALADGTEIRLAPYSKRGSGHFSAAIDASIIPEGVRRMATRGWVAIEEVNND